MFIIRNQKGNVLIRVTAVIAVVVVVFVMGAAVKVWNENRTTVEDQDALYPLRNKANDAFRSGEYTEAIALYSDILKNTQSGEAKADVQNSLATSLFLRNQKGDRESAGEILKKVTNETSLPPRVRAASAMILLDSFESSNDKQMVRDVVFSGEPFGPILKKTDRLDVAYREAYKRVYDIFPFPVAAFRVAHWYGRSLLYFSVDENKKDLFYDQLLEWTEKGDRAVTDENLKNYDQPKRATVYQLEALAHAYVGELSQGNAAMRDMHFEVAKNFFERSLAILSPEDEFAEYQTALYVRFYYAAFLARNYKDEKAEDVRVFLSPLVNRPEKFKDKNVGFEEFLLKISGNPQQDYNRSNLSDILSVYPELKDALANRGIVLQ